MEKGRTISDVLRNLDVSEPVLSCWVVAAKEPEGNENSRIEQLTMKAMKTAIRRENPRSGSIFHSARCSQCCSNDYQLHLERNKITPSMSHNKNPYDNAVAENFFSNMRCGSTKFYNFRTRSEVKQAVFEYMEGLNLICP